jgi:hypothetical protein
MILYCFEYKKAQNSAVGVGGVEGFCSIGVLTADGTSDGNFGQGSC